jgi:hypothetical protein
MLKLHEFVKNAWEFLNHIFMLHLFQKLFAAVDQVLSRYLKCIPIRAVSRYAIALLLFISNLRQRYLVCTSKRIQTAGCQKQWLS